MSDEWAVGASEISAVIEPKRLILITGGQGRLGRALSNASWPAGYRLATPCRGQLDICRADEVADWVQLYRPVLIINAAAFTSVDLAESEAAASFAVNAAGAANLAQAAAAAGAGLIHVSTDFVFDGEAGRPYVESDATGPLNIYGASKLAGERLVLERHSEALVLRTAWLLGGDGDSFVSAILRRAATGQSIGVVADQTGSPTDVNELARAIIVAADRLVQAPVPASLYHLAGAAAASWHEIADVSVQAWALLGGRLAPEVRAITSADWISLARRPRDSRLHSGAFESEFGVTLSGWRDKVVDWVSESMGRA